MPLRVLTEFLQVAWCPTLWMRRLGQFLDPCRISDTRTSRPCNRTVACETSRARIVSTRHQRQQSQGLPGIALLFSRSAGFSVSQSGFRRS
jgi:hypothetical protein